MDTFIEQIVRKKKNAKDSFIKISLMILIVILVTFLILFLGAYGMVSLGTLLAIGVIYGGFKLVAQYDIEYEYIVTNGELDIDKIIAKSHRKRLITIQASAFEKFAPYDENTSTGEEATTILAVGGRNPDYYANFKHPTFGNIRLIFSPDARVLEALSKYIPPRAKQ